MMGLNPTRQYQGTLGQASPIPHDILHSHILPDVLSVHLHYRLTGIAESRWDAFKVLPLVSKDFFQSCLALFSTIFGPTESESFTFVCPYSPSFFFSDGASGHK